MWPFKAYIVFFVVWFIVMGAPMTQADAIDAFYCAMKVSTEYSDSCWEMSESVFGNRGAEGRYGPATELTMEKWTDIRLELQLECLNYYDEQLCGGL